MRTEELATSAMQLDKVIYPVPTKLFPIVPLMLGRLMLLKLSVSPPLWNAGETQSLESESDGAYPSPPPFGWLDALQL